METFSAVRTFCEVARLGSFSAAAAALGMSPPSASRTISELEADLGVRLLNRTTRQVSLTEAGAEFRDRASLILEEYDALRQETRTLHSEPRGKLRVTSAIAFGTERVAPLIAAFQDRYPKLKVELHISNRKIDLLYENFDVAIRIGGREGLDDSSMMARRIAVQRQIFVATPGYLEQRTAPGCLEDLADHLMVKQISGSWGGISDFVTPTGTESFALPDDFVVNAPTAARNAVLEGCGIGLVAGYLVENEIASGRLVNVLPGYQTTEQPIYAVYAHRQFVAAKIRVFIDFLTGELRDA